MISFDQALGIHPDALKFRADRAEVISSNLANVDTPDFLARDITFDSMLNGELTGYVKTNKKHLPIDPNGERSSLLYRIPFQNSADGNTVELHTEQAQFTRNALQFQTSFTFLNKKIKGLEIAINGRV